MGLNGTNECENTVSERERENFIISAWQRERVARESVIRWRWLGAFYYGLFFRWEFHYKFNLRPTQKPHSHTLAHMSAAGRRRTAWIESFVLVLYLNQAMNRPKVDPAKWVLNSLFRQSQTNLAELLTKLFWGALRQHELITPMDL